MQGYVSIPSYSVQICITHKIRGTSSFIIFYCLSTIILENYQLGMRQEKLAVDSQSSPVPKPSTAILSGLTITQWTSVVSMPLKNRALSACPARDGSTSAATERPLPNLTAFRKQNKRVSSPFFHLDISSIIPFSSSVCLLSFWQTFSLYRHSLF